MIVYQLLKSHYNYDDGEVSCVLVTYTSKEEAEKAKEWCESLPEDPCAQYDYTYSIREVEVEEKFTPWLSIEEIDSMQETANDYYEYMEKTYGTNWYIPDDCPEE